jgi:hypothetical protein
MAETNTEYVAITVWWGQENVSSTEIYRKTGWTATDAALASAVAKAHELGMKVMLKPMVDPEDVYTHWRGEIPGSEEWFESYRSFINAYAKFAQANSVELFCIGCEFKATEYDEANWRQTISDVRSHYNGPLTYAATSDSFLSIPWWDSLDYIGIDAYFPLTTDSEPTQDKLEYSWNRIANAIEAWIHSVQKPVIFTEIGYRSGDGNNMEPGNWIIPLKTDLQEQFDTYSAAFETLWNRPWFYGFYWWIWETNPDAGGSYDNDFTPQNKPAQTLIKKWYGREQPFAQTLGLQMTATYTILVAAVTSATTLLYSTKLGRRKGHIEPR